MILKRIIYHIGRYILGAFLTLKSLPLLWKAARTPEQTILAKPYEGQPILLIALFQPSLLRPDVERLLVCAKRLGYYVIGINNTHLSSPQPTHWDTYIERINVGRDFGCFKTGFQYIFQQRWDERCPRLLMLNDSIYFDETRLETFLKSLFESPIEVLGATENFEIAYHLGSFCIAMSGTVLRNARFHHFWKHYALSEVRLTNIYKGEIGLSKCLQRCVVDPSQFQALFNLARVETTLRADPKNVDTFMALVRRSPYLSWPKLTGHPSIETILKYSKARSAIHLNAAFLVHLGMPLIKLDGFYRGAFGVEDVHLICEQLTPSEATEVKQHLYRRSYGGDSLFGWQEILYIWGFI